CGRCCQGGAAALAPAQGAPAAPGKGRCFRGHRGGPRGSHSAAQRASSQGLRRRREGPVLERDAQEVGGGSRSESQPRRRRRVAVLRPHGESAGGDCKSEGRYYRRGCASP
ncbi:unnamed protein product, partial [Symbiodinium pilosum]